MSDNEVSIVDPPPVQAPRQPTSAPSTPVRPKRKARALSAGNEDEYEDAGEPAPKPPAKRATRKKALDPPGAPKDRRSTIFLEEPPSTARPTTPAPNPRRASGPPARPAPVEAASTLDPPPTLDATPAAAGSVLRPAPTRANPVSDPTPGPDQPTTTRDQVPEGSTPAPTMPAQPAADAALAPAENLVDGNRMPTREEWAIFRSEMAEMRALLLGARGPPSFPSTAALEDTHGTLEPIQADPFSIAPLRTAPNGKNEMPPVSVCHLASSMFPAGKKSATEYHPLQVHSLAAHRLFKDLGYPPFEGRYSSPTSFVLALLESNIFKFRKVVPLAVALYSCRLGSRGASVLMFQETTDADDLARGSSNANFDLRFDSSLDPSPACTSYDQLLSALNGLGAVANEMWFDHGRKLISRLRAFVAKNKSADAHDTPERVKLTCDFVNKFLGRAMGYLQLENDQWWALYCEELKTVDVQNPEWGMALVNLMTVALHRETSRASQRRPEGSRSMSRDQPRDSAAKRPSRMPDHIKSLIPRNASGEEPCLRHFSGVGCPGRDGMCTNKKLVHKWPSQLPTPLLDWTRANMKRPDAVA